MSVRSLDLLECDEEQKYNVLGHNMQSQVISWAIRCKKLKYGENMGKMFHVVKISILAEQTYEMILKQEVLPKVYLRDV